MFNDLDLKRKLIDEMLSHLDSSQGMDLKNALDKASAPDLGDDGSDEVDELGKPKGLKIQSVEVMKPKDVMDEIGDDGDDESKPDPIKDMLDKKGMSDDGLEAAHGSDDQELSDDELEELLKKLM